MSRYAIIKDGTVANIVLSGDDFAAAQGWVAAPDYVGIGWHYGDGFGEPVVVVPVPHSVTPSQAKLALFYAGKLTDAESALGDLEEPQKTVASIYWTSALAFERDNEIITAMGALLNLTSEQIDDLFRTAATL